MVPEPDMRSADEVIAYLEKLRQYPVSRSVGLQASEGSMRADRNLSVREAGSIGVWYQDGDEELELFQGHCQP